MKNLTIKELQGIIKFYNYRDQTGKLFPKGSSNPGLERSTAFTGKNIREVCPGLEDEQVETLLKYWDDKPLNRLDTLACLELEDKNQEFKDIAKNLFYREAMILSWKQVLDQVLPDSKKALLLLPQIIEKIPLSGSKDWYSSESFPHDWRQRHSFIQWVDKYYPPEDSGKPNELLVKAMEIYDFGHDSVHDSGRERPSFEKEEILNASLCYIEKNRIHLEDSEIVNLYERVISDQWKWKGARDILDRYLDRYFKHRTFEFLIETIFSLDKSSPSELFTNKLIGFLSNTDLKGYDFDGLIRAQLKPLTAESKVIKAILADSNLPTHLSKKTLFSLARGGYDHSFANPAIWQKFSEVEKTELVVEYPEIRYQVLGTGERLNSKFVKSLYDSYKEFRNKTAMPALLEKYFLYDTVSVEMWITLFDKCNLEDKKNIIKAWNQYGKRKKIAIIKKFYNDTTFNKGATLLKLCKDNPYFAGLILSLPSATLKSYPPKWLAKLQLIKNEFEHKEIKDNGQIRKTDVQKLLEQFHHFERGLYSSGTMTSIGLSVKSFFTHPVKNGDEKYSHLAPKKQKAAAALDSFEFAENKGLTERGLWQVCAYLLNFYYDTQFENRQQFSEQLDSILKNPGERFDSLRNKLREVTKFHQQRRKADPDHQTDFGPEPGKDIVQSYLVSTGSKISLFSNGQLTEIPKQLNKETSNLIAPLPLPSDDSKETNGVTDLSPGADLESRDQPSRESASNEESELTAQIKQFEGLFEAYLRPAPEAPVEVKQGLTHPSPHSDAKSQSIEPVENAAKIQRESKERDESGLTPQMKKDFAKLFETYSRPLPKAPIKAGSVSKSQSIEKVQRKSEELNIPLAQYRSVADPELWTLETLSAQLAQSDVEVDFFFKTCVGEQNLPNIFSGYPQLIPLLLDKVKNLSEPCYRQLTELYVIANAQQESEELKELSARLSEKEDEVAQFFKYTIGQQNLPEIFSRYPQLIPQLLSKVKDLYDPWRRALVEIYATAKVQQESAELKISLPQTADPEFWTMDELSARMAQEDHYESVKFFTIYIPLISSKYPELIPQLLNKVQDRLSASYYVELVEKHAEKVPATGKGIRRADVLKLAAQFHGYAKGFHSESSSSLRSPEGLKPEKLSTLKKLMNLEYDNEGYLSNAGEQALANYFFTQFLEQTSSRFAFILTDLYPKLISLTGTQDIFANVTRDIIELYATYSKNQQEVARIQSLEEKIRALRELQSVKLESSECKESKPEILEVSPQKISPGFFPGVYPKLDHDTVGIDLTGPELKTIPQHQPEVEVSSVAATDPEVSVTTSPILVSQPEHANSESKENSVPEPKTVLRREPAMESKPLDGHQPQKTQSPLVESVRGFHNKKNTKRSKKEGANDQSKSVVMV